MILPDKWGQGALFSYSGAYGVKRNSSSLEGRLCADEFAIKFMTDNKCTLRIYSADIDDIKFETVMTDYIKAGLVIGEGKYDVTIVFADENTVVICSDYAIEVIPVFETAVTTKKTKKAVQYHSGNETFTLASRSANGKIAYAFSYGKNSADVTESVLDSGADSIIADKNSQLEALPEFRIPNEQIEKLYYRCCSILLACVNSPDGIIKSRYITPGKGEMNAMYSFWSAVCTLGLRHIAPDAAKETLESILASIAGDGMISARITPSDKDNNINPPVLAWCFWELYQVNNDKNMLVNAYSALKKYIHYIMESRDINKNQIFEWQIGIGEDSFGAESTMDNSPRFDDGIILDSVDLSSYIANEAASMSLIAEEIDKHGEALYWNVTFERIKASVNELLFDEDDKIYYDRAVVSGMFKKTKSSTAFLPLFAGVCENRHAMALLKLLNSPDRFNRKYGVPSISADSDEYCADMWRGPMHIYMNYFVSKGLEKYAMHDKANELKAKSLDAVLKEYVNSGAVYEYYSADGDCSPAIMPKKGMSTSSFMFASDSVNIRDFAPTAAVIIDMLLSRSKKMPSK
ncbi:MAG: hypothetical protein II998_00315 [Clostridia bacterium]|nr:hypothetical protein [Clostridia bacterium]